MYLCVCMVILHVFYDMPVYVCVCVCIYPQSPQIYFKTCIYFFQNTKKMYVCLVMRSIDMPYSSSADLLQDIIPFCLNVKVLMLMLMLEVVLIS